MGSQEYAQPVRGSGAEPISTTQTSAFEVDNYDDGEFVSGDVYPLSMDPLIDIQHMVIIENPGDKTIDLVTTAGNTISGVPLGSGNLSLTGLSIDNITVNDPTGTVGTTTILGVGE